MGTLPKYIVTQTSFCQGVLVSAGEEVWRLGLWGATPDHRIANFKTVKGEIIPMFENEVEEVTQ